MGPNRKDARVDSRASFERWIQEFPYERSVERTADDSLWWPGQYCAYEVQLAWEAWKKGRRQALTMKRKKARKGLK